MYSLRAFHQERIKLLARDQIKVALRTRWIRQSETQATSTLREGSKHPEEDWWNSKVYKLYRTMRTPSPLVNKQHTGP